MTHDASSTTAPVQPTRIKEIVVSATVSPRASSTFVARLRGVPTIIYVLVALATLMSFIAPNFLTARNMVSILDQNAPLMLLAMGTTFVILAGGFDLSNGQILSVVGVTSASVALTTGTAVLGLITGIAVAIGLGAVNGILVGTLKVNSFLATLASGFVMGGLALLITQGFSVDLSSDETFRWLGSSNYGGLSTSVWLCLAVFIVLTYLLHFTPFGRKVLSVGSNARAARLSGISTARITLLVYVIGGFAAALAGLVLVTRTGVGNVYGQASGITLSAIAAVVIGGTSILGGRGSVWRTVAGVLLLALLQNAFNLLNIQPYWQQIASGAIIILALLANSGRLRR